MGLVTGMQTARLSRPAGLALIRAYNATIRNERHRHPFPFRHQAEGYQVHGEIFRQDVHQWLQLSKYTFDSYQICCLRR